VVNDEGHVYTWGRGSEGQLGHGKLESQPVPRRVEYIAGKVRATKATAGSTHTVILSDGGDVYEFGYTRINRQGLVLPRRIRIGNEPGPHGLCFPPTIQAHRPSSSRIVDISAASGTTIAVTETGEVFSWGETNNGADSVPVKVNGFKGRKIVSCAAAKDFTLAVSDGGELFSWGKNAVGGVLGLGGEYVKSSPTEVYAMIHVLAVSCSDSHSVAISSMMDVRSNQIAVVVDPAPAVHHLSAEEMGRDVLVEVYPGAEGCTDPVLVSKHLLSLKCEYFNAMFSLPMEMLEANQSHVTIADVSRPVLELVIEFLKKDWVEIPLDLAPEILAAADSLLLNRLKQLCEKALLQSLDLSNCCSIASFADMHSAYQLKDRCVKFIARHVARLVVTRTLTQESMSESVFKAVEDELRRLRLVAMYHFEEGYGVEWGASTYDDSSDPLANDDVDIFPDWEDQNTSPAAFARERRLSATAPFATRRTSYSSLTQALSRSPLPPRPPSPQSTRPRTMSFPPPTPPGGPSLNTPLPDTSSATNSNRSLLIASNHRLMSGSPLPPPPPPPSSVSSLSSRSPVLMTVTTSGLASSSTIDSPAILETGSGSNNSRSPLVTTPPVSANNSPMSSMSLPMSMTYSPGASSSSSSSSAASAHRTVTTNVNYARDSSNASGGPWNTSGVSRVEEMGGHQQAVGGTQGKKTPPNHSSADANFLTPAAIHTKRSDEASSGDGGVLLPQQPLQARLSGLRPEDERIDEKYAGSNSQQRVVVADENAVAKNSSTPRASRKKHKAIPLAKLEEALKEPTPPPPLSEQHPLKASGPVWNNMAIEALKAATSQIKSLREILAEEEAASKRSPVSLKGKPPPPSKPAPALVAPLKTSPPKVTAAVTGQAQVPAKGHVAKQHVTTGSATSGASSASAKQPVTSVAPQPSIGTAKPPVTTNPIMANPVAPPVRLSRPPAVSLKEVLKQEEMQRSLAASGVGGQVVESATIRLSPDDPYFVPSLGDYLSSLTDLESSKKKNNNNNKKKRGATLPGVAAHPDQPPPTTGPPPTSSGDLSSSGMSGGGSVAPWFKGNSSGTITTTTGGMSCSSQQGMVGVGANSNGKSLREIQVEEERAAFEIQRLQEKVLEGATVTSWGLRTFPRHQSLKNIQTEEKAIQEIQSFYQRQQRRFTQPITVHRASA